MTSVNRTRSRLQIRHGGFSLLETMIALLILVIGLVALAGLFGQSLTFLQSTREDLIAKQKAREALEGVYSARNDATVGFAGIQNVNNGGIFLNGFQPMFLAGPNGIVGTQGQSAVLDRQILPGKDGIMNTGDDEIIPLSNFQRQILIQPLIDSTGNVSPDIRQISVTVQVTSPGRGARNYTVTGYISRFQ
jgi:prepilin-type N-terminal cleavage/methylation domain-containing protein